MKLNQIKNWDRSQVLDAFEREHINQNDVYLYDFYHQNYRWPLFTGKDVKELRESCQLTQLELATLLGVDTTTVVRWEQMENELPALVKVLLTYVQKNGPFALVQWLDTKPKEQETIADKLKKARIKAEINKTRAENVEDKASLAYWVGSLPPYSEEITSDDIVRVRNRMNLNRKQFAQMLNVSKSVVGKWEAGVIKISGLPDTLFRILIKNDTISQWLEVGLRRQEFKEKFERQDSDAHPFRF